jgi:methylglyoxal reductase
MMPAVAFGAWAIGGWLWGGVDDEKAIRAIQRGIDEGITCIDTAPVYGLGHSEELVGRAVKGRRDEVLLATKCGLVWDHDTGKEGFMAQRPDGTSAEVVRSLTPASVREEVDQSLRRLQTDVIDLYQCHWPDPDTPIADTMEALVDIRKQGKIRAIGVSNFSVDQMKECLEVVHIASDQPRYNALDRRIEKDLLPFCRDNHIGILAYSSIAQGLLTGKVSLDREFPETDLRYGHPLFSRENRRRILRMLEQVQPIADAHGATLGQVAINWVISQPGVTVALAGARNEEQVVENARAADFQLDEEELATIRDLVEGLTLLV